MPGHSTVAARCAAIGSGIAQIIADTTSTARGLRSARHHIIDISADLVAIKIALDITHDDFSTANPCMPAVLTDAVSQLLDCCSTATEGWHKPIILLSASDDRIAAWKTLKAAHWVDLKNDIEAVRCALDLLPDLVDLFAQPSNTKPAITSPNRQSFLDDSDPDVWQGFLERVDSDRFHIDDLIQARLPGLGHAFDKIRACVTFRLNECLSPFASPKRLRVQHGRIVKVTPFDLSKEKGRTDKSLPPLPSPLSVSSGIGAWIANVVSQHIESPTAPTPSLALTDPRGNHATLSSDDRGPSIDSYYEGSFTTTSARKSRHRKSLPPPMPSLERVDSPQLEMKTPKMPNAKKMNGIYAITSTLLSSDERSIIHQQITNDKIAVAKESRRQLDRQQKVTVDAKLKRICERTTASEVEQYLWNGADPNAADLQFGSVLIRAAHSCSTKILRLLVEYGADVTQTSHSAYYSAMHAAALGNNISNLQWLVETGLNFDAPNQQGETPLHLAVKTPGGYNVVNWLLDMGADVNKEALDTTTPFQMAMGPSKVDSRERSMIIQLLLGYGAVGELSRNNTKSRGKGLIVLGLA